MPFAPTEFTQLNYAVNGVLVRRAMALLARTGARARVQAGGGGRGQHVPADGAQVESIARFD